MDLKNFQHVEGEPTHGPEHKDNINHLVDEEFHEESDRIIRDLEARIAAIDADTKTEPEESTHDVPGSSDDLLYPEDIQEVIVQEGDGKSFIEKLTPFMFPVFLTIFALLFAVIFMYFFSKVRVERSAQAIINNQTQPEVIVVKEEKPTVEVTVEPEPEIEIAVPECDKETEILNTETSKCDKIEKLEPQGATTTATTTAPQTTTSPVIAPTVAPSNTNGKIVRVRFSFDRNYYDNHPRGIYMLGKQAFGAEGDFDGYKLLPTSRPDANDMFFGLNRYMVSLIGACQFVVDEADVLVTSLNDSKGGQVYEAIGDKYFTGKVEKILKSSKPHVVCQE